MSVFFIFNKFLPKLVPFARPVLAVSSHEYLFRVSSILYLSIGQRPGALAVWLVWQAARGEKPVATGC